MSADRARWPDRSPARTRRARLIAQLHAAPVPRRKYRSRDEHPRYGAFGASRIGAVVHEVYSARSGERVSAFRVCYTLQILDFARAFHRFATAAAGAEVTAGASGESLDRRNESARHRGRNSGRRQDGRRTRLSRAYHPRRRAHRRRMRRRGARRSISSSISSRQRRRARDAGAASRSSSPRARSVPEGSIDRRRRREDRRQQDRHHGGTVRGRKRGAGRGCGRRGQGGRRRTCCAAARSSRALRPTLFRAWKAKG